MVSCDRKAGTPHRGARLQESLCKVTVAKGGVEEERQVPRYWGGHGLGSSSPGSRAQVLQGGVGVARMDCLGRALSLPVAPMSTFLARYWHNPYFLFA